MKIGKTKFLKRDGWGFIYIPADIVKDSAFPFKDKDRLTISITNEKLEIRKVGTE